MKNPDDIAELITAETVPGRGYGLGVQIPHADEQTLERYAVVIPEHETRRGIVEKLLLLAAAVQSGEGAVIGQSGLQGNELNSREFPKLSDSKRVDGHNSGFQPASYVQWREKAMRALDELTKTRPAFLP